MSRVIYYGASGRDLFRLAEIAYFVTSSEDLPQSQHIATLARVITGLLSRLGDRHQRDEEAGEAWAPLIQSAALVLRLQDHRACVLLAHCLRRTARVAGSEVRVWCPSFSPCLLKNSPSPQTHTHTYTNTHHTHTRNTHGIHTHTHIYKHTHSHIHIYKHKHSHIHIYKHKHTHTHTHTLNTKRTHTRTEHTRTHTVTVTHTIIHTHGHTRELFI